MYECITKWERNLTLLSVIVAIVALTREYRFWYSNMHNKFINLSSCQVLCHAGGDIFHAYVSVLRQWRFSMILKCNKQASSATEAQDLKQAVCEFVIYVTEM